MMKIAILTTARQWFEPYAYKFSKEYENFTVYTDHNKIINRYDILFILSYHRIVEEAQLQKNNYNIVIHESSLPSGKGWAPLFWQILEKKREIVFTLFEASNGLDSGDIFFQQTLYLTGYELNKELREKQAKLVIKMCKEFVKNYKNYLPAKKQLGRETFYPRREPVDSELDIDKTIKEQFNLLRIVDNKDYPAFFKIDGRRYNLKIEIERG
jgi:methionyl-tRNA formyltransferase